MMCLQRSQFGRQTWGLQIHESRAGFPIIREQKRAPANNAADGGAAGESLEAKV
jgi:hypothetical protein